MTTSPPARDDFTFFHDLRVRWAEVDAQGIVFSAHYVMYFDLAMTEYMRAIGVPYPDVLKSEGSDSFIVHASVNYRASAAYDDELSIGARVARIGRTSMTFEFAVLRAGQVLADGILIYVNGTLDGKKPTPWPAAFLERITAFERTAPERA